MRAVYKFLGSLTLAALLCAGAAKHSNIRAEFAGPYEGLRLELERRAYRLEKSGDGAYHGRNPAQQFDLDFNIREARLNHPKATAALRLIGYGYGERLRTPAPAAPTAAANRVEYRRGEPNEWYLNEPRGLEQGFTLTLRPGMARAGEPLVIAVSVSGGLHPVLNAKGDAILLIADGRSVLRYEGLLSRDAAGHELPAKLEVREREIRLVVEDGAAVYPLSVEGLVNEAPPSAPPPPSYLISTYAGGLPTATSATATTYPLLLVNAVAVDPAGNTFISSRLNCVFKLDSAGNLTRVAGTGKAGYSGDGGPAANAQLDSPQGLALDLAGNLYIADYYNQRVRRVSPNGVIITVAGNGVAGHSGDSGPATSAQLNSPQGVAVDSAGNLYIADSGNQRIRRVSANGTITTAAGTGTAGYSGDSGLATSAQLCNPLGVAVDANGNLYIADTGFLFQGPSGNRIRMVSTSGIITTVAGNGTWGFSTDGGTATTAALENPYSVAVDSAGNLYITDTYTHRIREVSAGIITTVAGNSNQGFKGDGGAATSAWLNTPEGVAVDVASPATCTSRTAKTAASGKSQPRTKPSRPSPAAARFPSPAMEVLRAWRNLAAPSAWPRTRAATSISQTPTTAAFARSRQMARSALWPALALTAIRATMDLPPAPNSILRPTWRLIAPVTCISRTQD